MTVQGTYCLSIEVDRDLEIKVGALGVTYFLKGKYVYIGSALNSMIPRLERHLRQSNGEHNVTHWHIDYLLKNPSTSITSIHINDNGKRLECSYAEKIAKHGHPTKGFGCSDCKCTSHLYKVESTISFEKMGMKKWF